MSDRFKNYVSVAERLNDAAPDISHVETEAPVMLTDVMGFIRARVALQDGRSATGTASFRLDLQGKGAQATNPLEDGETSAVGRALAFLGYSSSRAIATREDVHEAQRREAASYQRPARPEPPAAKPAPQTQAPANGRPQSVTEAKRRFFARYADKAGSTWPMVQGFLGIQDAEPTTIEGWIAAAEAVRARQSAAIADEWDAIDAAQAA